MLFDESGLLAICGSIFGIGAALLVQCGGNKRNPPKKAITARSKSKSKRSVRGKPSSSSKRVKSAKAPGSSRSTRSASKVGHSYLTALTYFIEVGSFQQGNQAEGQVFQR
jgi:hypothetical protein